VEKIEIMFMCKDVVENIMGYIDSPPCVSQALLEFEDPAHSQYNP